MAFNRKHLKIMADHWDNRAWRLGEFDKQSRWTPNDSVARLYIRDHSIRPPSAAYPFSYLNAVKTQKFIQWVFDNHPETAESWRLAKPLSDLL